MSNNAWYTPENMNEVCEHGSQRRKCVNCESAWQDERITELEKELSLVKAEDPKGAAFGQMVLDLMAKCQELQSELAVLQDKNARLLTLATKWVDTSHHDFEEIKQIAEGGTK